MMEEGSRVELAGLFLKMINRNGTLLMKVKWSHNPIDGTCRPSLAMACKTWARELSDVQNDGREEDGYEATQNHTPKLAT